MGKRNPVTLVSAVVKRNSAVVTGNLCEANISPTTISPLPIATRVIMTCKIVKAPTDIPRIIDSSFVGVLFRNCDSSLHFDDLDPVRTLAHRIACRLVELSVRFFDPVHPQPLPFFSRRPT